MAKLKASVIEIANINLVNLNPNNPRIIKDDKFKKLVQSIKDFPEMLHIRPIVVNGDMVVLGGNMRYRACKEAGLKQIPIIKAENLTEDQQKEFIIKDNISGGEWDWDILSSEWDAEQLDEWGLDIPDFKGADHEDLSDQISSQFKIEITCSDESDQEKIYNELLSKGYSCRVLTL